MLFRSQLGKAIPLVVKSNPREEPFPTAVKQTDWKLKFDWRRKQLHRQQLRLGEGVNDRPDRTAYEDDKRREDHGDRGDFGAEISEKSQPTTLLFGGRHHIPLPAQYPGQGTAELIH